MAYDDLVACRPVIVTACCPNCSPGPLRSATESLFRSGCNDMAPPDEVTGGNPAQAARELEWTRLMHAAIDGDNQAYRTLLVSLTPCLRSLAKRGFERVGLGNSEIEDVVQETLLAIHLKRGTWDRSRSLGPWVSAIARYKLVDSLRRKGRTTDLPIEDVADWLADDAANEGSARHDADSMLETLKGRDQDIVRSISIDGQPVRDVAQKLGMTEVAVRVSLHRSLKRLAERFRGE
jgi:RNA polymerase sigma factor (sigma-70 family)